MSKIIPMVKMYKTHSQDKIKYKLPIINKNHFKLVMGLRYFHEDFLFESPDEVD